ncbi:hypothetical protein [Proteus mirabilis]|uniref:hypothetical protein n=1 Tax=Proteus mirabilis TaxID=584 RepID=UPI0024E101D8|nr:hypothetical protein [Proteus mirabilis]
MYNKFRLNSSTLNQFNEMFSKNEPDDRLIYADKTSDSIQRAIYETVHGEISSEKLIHFLFPKEKKPHIFISHSSKDANLAIKFANKIYKDAGIVSFIDSQIWSHIELAINEMHKDYCQIPDSKSYSYAKSNILLSNLYSLLSIALMDVMDSSDSVIFIKSQNSTLDKIINNDAWNTGEDLSSSEATYSPWIYSEINYANKLRKKYHEDRVLSISESIKKSASFGLEPKANDAMPKFRHPIDISNFDEITLEALFCVNSHFKKTNTAIENLDLLYKYVFEPNQ